MRHDAKLGLALGMLVIGFALAFCFPRRPDNAAMKRPVLPSPHDPTLGFLAIRAYQLPADSSAIQESSPPAPNPSISIRPPDPPVSSSASTTVSIVTPTPIAPLVMETIPEADLSALPLRASPATTPQTTAMQAKRAEEDGILQEESPEVPALPQLYRVQPGDTLSGIASRNLGSAGRYMKLYEANRDRLASPDDLKIGMELVIPPPGAATQTAQEEPATDRRGASLPWNGRKLPGFGKPVQARRPAQNPATTADITDQTPSRQ